MVRANRKSKYQFARKRERKNNSRQRPVNPGSIHHKSRKSGYPAPAAAAENVICRSRLAPELGHLVAGKNVSLDALLADGGETDETARRTIATHRQTEGNKDQILNMTISH